jgi:5'-deoxynucleotidase YfbR-like HD superfamily hydrolase
MERGILRLFLRAGRLKEVKRSGWVRHGISDSESVADHSFRTSFMAMIVGDSLNLDSDKLMRMALIHDLAEAVAGDITPYDDISLEEKHEMEKEAINELFGNLTDGSRYIDLWVEYENGESQEARLVRSLDKLEMAITASEYQRMNPTLNLAEFIQKAEESIDIPEVKAILSEVKSSG